MRDLSDKELIIKTVRDVAGDVGLEELFKRCNLTEIWIPLDPGPDHWMSELWGQDKAQEVSRRLTTVNADGRRVCNMRAYISNGLSRREILLMQLNKEVRDALLAGNNVRDVVRIVGVSEHSVRKELKLLREGGVLDTPLIKGNKYAPRALPAPKPDVEYLTRAEERKALWEIKASIVDDGVMRGQSNRRVATSAQVSISYVRIRRKLLLASGKLKPGRLHVEAA